MGYFSQNYRLDLVFEAYVIRAFEILLLLQEGSQIVVQNEHGNETRENNIELHSMLSLLHYCFSLPKPLHLQLTHQLFRFFLTQFQFVEKRKFPEERDDCSALF